VSGPQAVKIKATLSWDVALCILVDSYDILDYTASYPTYIYYTSPSITNLAGFLDVQNNGDILRLSIGPLERSFRRQKTFLFILIFTQQNEIKYPLYKIINLTM
jgi:hypothetical protein